MRVVLSPKAHSDRAARWNYLGQFSWAAADNTNAQISKYLRLLGEYPGLGKLGRVADTREFPIGNTRLIAVYRIEQDRIWVIRLMHGAQEWPARF